MQSRGLVPWMGRPAPQPGWAGRSIVFPRLSPQKLAETSELLRTEPCDQISFSSSECLVFD